MATPPEIRILQVGYFFLFVTLALMTWAYMVRAEAFPFQSSGPSMAKGQSGTILDEFPPCVFNPLCKCSNPGPTDFGVVTCHAVPFTSLPPAVKTTRIFVLSMVDNGLDYLADRQLIGSGAWRLEIRDNKLTAIGDDSLIGCEKTLYELDFRNNELTYIPTSAMFRLQKLTYLDLSYNKIADVESSDFEGLPTSLSYLSLAGNLITDIKKDAFTHLPALKTLDLSHNNIRIIDAHAFASNSKSLNTLILVGNILDRIPFEALVELDLELLDLSYNLITSTFDATYEEKKIRTLNLKLDGNQICVIEPFGFQNMEDVTYLSLQQNPITVVEEDAFRPLILTHLDLSHCFISKIHSSAFNGLHDSLQKLNLGFNNITQLPIELFEGLNQLTSLNLDENGLYFTHGNQLQPLRYTLQELSLIGDGILILPLVELKWMRNLRNLNLSLHSQSEILHTEMFDGFGGTVCEVRFSRSRLTTIKNEAFRHIPTLKVIDLSSNWIKRIDNEAFAYVGHSVRKLILRSALRMTVVSPIVWEKLTTLQELDLSGNGLHAVPESSFEKNSEIAYLNLRFNSLKELGTYLFKPLTKLHRVFLSFNNLKEIQKGTFENLKDLELVELNENELEAIEDEAFQNLANLRILNLAGNRLQELRNESFKNIPKVQLIDLSYNQLTTLNYQAFEHVGTMSHFKINLSHNKISDLSLPQEIKFQQRIPANETTRDDLEIQLREIIPVFTTSIEEINFSHNNISYISPFFFTATGNSLITLNLSYNKIGNVTRDQLDGMKHLQKLNLGHNRIQNFEFEAFLAIPSIQILNLDYNNLKELSGELFDPCTKLRILSARGNHLRNFNDGLFKNTQIEILDFSDNSMQRINEAALFALGPSLIKFDFSGNNLPNLSPTFLSKFSKLRWLSLGNNKIMYVVENAFDGLVSLDYLDLSGNPLGRIVDRWFEEIRKHLLFLNIANTSLDKLPDSIGNLTHLITLNASHNGLTEFPGNFIKNIYNAMTLDVSWNQFSSFASIFNAMPNLINIYVQGNPTQVFDEKSFNQLNKVQKLDISDLPLELFTIASLAPLIYLKELIIGPLENDGRGIYEPAMYIQDLKNLQSLHLKIHKLKMDNELQTDVLPAKLANITISGTKLKIIHADALDNLRNRYLKLRIENTGIVELSEDFFSKLGEATIISLEIDNNSVLTQIENPNKNHRPEPFAPFLVNLDIDPESTLTCSCDIGWIEFWLRHWMDQECPISSVTPKKDMERCDTMLRSFRAIQCGNKVGTSISEAFVSELECGWESSSFRIIPSQFLNLLLLILVVVILKA